MFNGILRGRTAFCDLFNWAQHRSIPRIAQILRKAASPGSLPEFGKPVMLAVRFAT
jgi:hypothetical protein